MLALLIALLLLPLPHPSDPEARHLVDTALDRMGGAEAVAQVTQVRLDLMTQWQRTTFTATPTADGPSYERNTELRDYRLPAWRNTRRFSVGTSWRTIVDVVRDSVAIRQMNDAWGGLNAAYLDERREVFTFAPERVLLLAREAADLRLLPDTLRDGTAYARVAATLDGFPTTLSFRRADGFLASAEYRAAQPFDFGLAGWGTMDVALWYGRWQPVGALVYPMQWDVYRVGRPYKRLSVLAADFAPAAPADSFAVSDSLRSAFFAAFNRPMHDLPLNAARMVDSAFVTFGTPGAPAGAVRLGRRWLMLEAGVDPLTAQRAADWLAHATPEASVAGAVVTFGTAGSGGLAWLAEQGLPVYAAPGATPFAEAIARGHGLPAGTARPVTAARQLDVDGTAVWLAPLDLPDAPGVLVVYVPALRWAYAASAASPVHLARVRAFLEAQGWQADRIGHARDVAPSP